MRLTVCTLIWEPNEKSHQFSLAYTDEWARKLFNGFRRNLRVPYRCVLYTDRKRDLPENIEQIVQPDLGSNGYGDCIRPFELNEPMILAGLDTLVAGNCDKFARYCFEADRIALPKHPFHDYAINGVVFCPGGQRRIYDEWRGENDMDWLRLQPYHLIDDLWPRKVVSYKAHVRGRPFWPKTRIIYFHGSPKMEVLPNDPIVKRFWK